MIGRDADDRAARHVSAAPLLHRTVGETSSYPRVFEVSGTSGMYSHAALQRLFCDVFTGSKNIGFPWDENAESYGRVRLGLEPVARSIDCSWSASGRTCRALGWLSSAAVQAMLRAKTFWLLATVNEDGSPSCTPVWVDYDGECVVVNTAVGRQKERNVRHERRVCSASPTRPTPTTGSRFEVRSPT